MKNNNIRIWAKGNGITLEQHTKDLLTQFEILKSSLARKIENISVNQEVLTRKEELAIITHDLGKFLSSFQKRLGNTDYAFEVGKFFLKAPHSLVSILFQLEGEEILVEIDKRILNSVVAYHHYRDYFDKLITSSDSDIHQTAKELLEDTTWREEVLKLLQRETNR